MQWAPSGQGLANPWGVTLTSVAFRGSELAVTLGDEHAAWLVDGVWWRATTERDRDLTPLPEALDAIVGWLAERGVMLPKGGA